MTNEQLIKLRLNSLKNHLKDAKKYLTKASNHLGYIEGLESAIVILGQITDYENNDKRSNYA